MTKPTKAQKNLLLARWALPNYTWKIASTGIAMGASKDNSVRPGVAMFLDFDISKPSDRAKVIMKLKADHNITINERTRDSKPLWEAVSQDGVNMRGRQWHPDLGELLVQIIEGLK